MNDVDHYVVVIHGGTEISTLGPRKTDKERDDLARETFKDDNFKSDFSTLFWMNVDENRNINVGVYTEAELENDLGGSD